MDLRPESVGLIKGQETHVSKGRAESGEGGEVMECSVAT